MYVQGTMHTLCAAHTCLVTSNCTDYFPGLRPLNAAAAGTPLQLKHLISMAGGSNVTYWAAGPWAQGLRQGPPGEV